MSVKKWPVLPSDCRWTIIREAGNNKRGQSTYQVRCSCHDRTVKIVVGSTLTTGQSKSCGCLQKEKAIARAKWPVLPIDSRWIILGKVQKTSNRSMQYQVQCTCRKKTLRVMCGRLLSTGHSKSCGCLRGELLSKRCKKWPILPPDSRWTIVREEAKDKHGSTTYLVRCSCSAKTLRTIAGFRLTNGHSRSCGCLSRETTSYFFKKEPVLPPDCRWTILGEAKRNKRRQRCYHVQCRCPKRSIKILVGADLTAGKSKSCGCLRTEGCSKQVIFSEVVSHFGYLSGIEETIENIEKEIMTVQPRGSI
jgi:hypothetical protein